MHKLMECFLKGLRRLLNVSKPVRLSTHELLSSIRSEYYLGLPSEELVCQLLESSVLPVAPGAGFTASLDSGIVHLNPE